MATLKDSPAEASGIFYGTSLMIPFSLARSAPSILPSNFLKRNFLFGKTRSKSVKPNRPENSGSKSKTGLRAVLDLDRSRNTNKNLFLRPLVITHFPIITHHAPPVRVFQPKPKNHSIIRVQLGSLYSKLEKFLLSFGARVPNVVIKPNPENVVVTRMLSDQVLTKKCTRKKAKRPNDHRAPRRSSLMICDDDLNLGPIYPTSSFLINCYNCKRKLKYTKDIYIYKGEMSFCSIPCREREMFYDEMRERRAKASCSTSRMTTGNPSLRNLRGRGP